MAKLINCLALLVVCTAVHGVIYECANQSGCSKAKEAPCCLSKNIPRGKRSVQYGSITTSLPGKCVPFGGEGASCLLQQINDPYYKCPCEPGLICVDSGNTELPLGAVGVCRKPCTSDKQCSVNQCCQKDPQLKGRKKRMVDTGVCKPFGNEGEECVLVDPQDVFHSRCPCSSGLGCVDDGINTVPVNYGTCQP